MDAGLTGFNLGVGFVAGADKGYGAQIEAVELKLELIAVAHFHHLRIHEGFAQYRFRLVYIAGREDGEFSHCIN